MRLNHAFLSSSHPCGRGPNKENFTKKFYKQSKLGVGAPTQKITKVILQAKQVGVGAPAKRIS
ncbi:hypothetical protein BUZ39_05105 [Staphylococcus haemolyticus]|nr:hypothetical protein BUZ39_05105 [Staphylococcus haemolyticus]